MSHGSDPYDLASLIVAHDDPHVFDAVVPPIVQTSLFTFSSYEEMLATYQGKRCGLSLYAWTEPDRAPLRGNAGQDGRRRGRARLRQRHGRHFGGGYCPSSSPATALSPSGMSIPTRSVCSARS